MISFTEELHELLTLFCKQYVHLKKNQFILHISMCQLMYHFLFVYKEYESQN